MYYEVYEGQDGNYYFRGFFADNEQVLRSDPFPNELKATEGKDNTIHAIKKRGRDSIRGKKTENGKKYFTIQDTNGNDLAHSSQVFDTVEEMNKVIEKLLDE